MNFSKKIEINHKIKGVSSKLWIKRGCSFRETVGGIIYKNNIKDVTLVRIINSFPSTTYLTVKGPRHREHRNFRNRFEEYKGCFCLFH